MPLSVRCGTDLIKINRISMAVQRHGQPFLDRIWTRQEQADCLPDGHLTAAGAASLAARFAAKEAVAKALGTGIGQAGIRWTDLSVHRSSSGEPAVLLAHAALDAFRNLGGRSISISLSHENDLAMAFCVLLHKEQASRKIRPGAARKPIHEK